MSAFQVAAAVATGVLTIEGAAVATGVLAIGAIGAIAVNHMQPTQYDISEEMLSFYDSDYEFYRYLREHEEIFAYSVNNYGLTMGVNRVRANMRLEQWQQQNNRTREEIPQVQNIHQTTEECRFRGNFDASQFVASFEFSWTKSTVFK